ncbi:hypothetical protein ABVK25_003542 [Lepraria finkii]|uniref:Uncharacterized protein n=1 Tax=Lepraria finkii TaxID=1340010 RepID=A0ABR4BDT8_9LECA
MLQRLLLSQSTRYDNPADEKMAWHSGPGVQRYPRRRGLNPPRRILNKVSCISIRTPVGIGTTLERVSMSNAAEAMIASQPIFSSRSFRILRSPTIGNASVLQN